MDLQEKIYKNHALSFPAPVYTKDEESELHKFLKAIADVDAEHHQEMINAREQKFTKYASGKWLEVRGANFNRQRPKGFNMSDDTYRELIKLMSFHPMQTYPIFEKLADLFFGPDSIIRDMIKIFSVDPALIEIAIKKYALVVAARRGLIGATYLHGDHDLAINDYYSGYVYPRKKVTTLSPPAIVPGETLLDISANQEDFPETGEVICIGEKDSAEWESRYYTGRVGDILTLSRPTSIGHAPGTKIFIPVYITKHEIVLNENLTSGLSYSDIATSNSADFPDLEGAVWFNYHKKNAREKVPYRARLNNGTITLDDTYVMKNSYPSGSIITLCAKSSAHNIDGTDYAFYINGTEGLADYIKSVFLEVKAEGVRADITVV